MRITHVAIVDAAGEVWSLIAPARHHDVMALMRERKPDYSVLDVSPTRQGFLVDGNWYVGRKEAWKIAKEYGLFLPYRVQDGIVVKHIPFQDGTLFSEDVW